MISEGGASRLRRVRACALGTSAITLAAIIGGPAFAQCAPDPTIANGTTTCRGVDADGLVVTTPGTRVAVEQGASVLGAGAPAVAVRVASSNWFDPPVSLDVAGTVDGGSAAGVSLVPQGSGFVTRSLNVTVAASGVISGATGIAIDPGSGSSSAGASIDNSGTIVGTGGIALLASDPNRTGFTSIVNRAGGSIGAISGSVGTLTNAGTIEGGSRSAVDWGTEFFAFGDVTNSGVIGSSGSVATLANLSGRALTNTGTVENRGTGAAIAATGGMSILNGANGRIASGGAIAIAADDGLSLTNQGTIVGDVVAGSAFGLGSSTIDSTAGRIVGALRLGGGDDTLVARFDGTQLTYGIDGTIDGGAGTDTIRTAFADDTTLASALVLPTDFERLALAPDFGATVTLANGFAAPGVLLVGGSGTLVNRTTLSGTGQILLDEFGNGSPSFVNAGAIVSTGGSAGTFAVALNSFNSFRNDGTITADVDAVSLFGYGPIVNAGTISAGGVALSAFSSDFSNLASGLIRSSGDTALVLSGSSFGADASNAGRIEGGTVGAELGTTLVNTGTITGGTTGVLLTGYGTLDNRAGGVVSSAGDAVSASFGTFGLFSFNTTVANAGTITGDVVLGNVARSDNNNNRFFALPGGVLNGDLVLGNGDLLVTELAGTANGTFAGITGTVSASGAQLRLRVREDSTAVLATPAGFANTGYELFDDAALTLTGAAGALPLTLSGIGSVDLTADIATTTGPAIQHVSGSIAPGETGADDALAITSRGALSLTRTDANTFPGAAVALGGSDSFTNTGTITVTDSTTGSFGRIAAITGGFSFSFDGGTTVINSGTITLSGATGISGARTVTNSGSIVQASGGQAATGIEVSSSSGLTLVNTGTIDVGGVAVQTDYGRLTIDNSGRLASSGTVAISADSGFAVAITNAAGATIAGGAGTAIRSGGGTITNAGTITGTVDLGYSSYGGRSFSAGSYIADGGTIAGDLLFGSGDDTLVSFGTLGVSGRIDGGNGFDTLVQARRASGTVSLDLAGVSGFEALGVRALGSATIVTVRADAPLAGDLTPSGDGAVVNTATIRGRISIANPGRYDGGTFVPGPVLASFTNQGEVANGVFGETRAFANSGTIGSSTLRNSAVAIYGSGTLQFANTGAITSDGSAPAVWLSLTDATTFAATNGGTITGGFAASASSGAQTTTAPAAVSLTNGGTITGAARFDPAVRLAADFSEGTGTLTLANNGTIAATARSGTAATLITSRYGEGDGGQMIVTNTGTIRANAGGFKDVPVDPYAGASIAYPFTYAATALKLFPGGADAAQVTNTTGGTIEATGDLSVAVLTQSGTLNLSNEGTIRGTAGTVLTSDDRLIEVLDDTFLAGAVQAGGGDDRIVNTGTIVGSVNLGAGADRIDNLGRIEGNVFLGAGDDTFLQRASGTLTGTVDAGAGDDLFIVDATGGGTVNGDQFVNFERFQQVGQGNVGYAGTFRFETIGVSGGTVTVAAGQTLSSTGAFTVTGTDTAETVVNDGTIAGGVTMGAGNDRVVNRGVIGGPVLLGDGDDSFVEGAGSRVDGLVSGGAGTDTYVAALTGDRTGLRPRTGFEQLGVEGSGTLTLTLDQSFAATSLTGAGLSVALNSFTLGPVTGSDVSEQLSVDGDVADVALGGGNDTLVLGTTQASGRYDGGTGTDLLRFTATAPVTLTGSVTGFEQVNVAGDFTIASGASLTGGQVSFGAGNQRLTIAGAFAGSVDGGAGTDTIAVSSGSATAPVAFASVTGVESLAMTGGYATVSGTAGFGAVDLGAGRLVGLAGSTITATQIAVRQGATFGSAGSVNGNVTVAGILSPGASPGTMTVNGNVALGSTSLSLFELTPTAQDKLVVNGAVSIAQGATLQLAPSGTLRPGTSYDLITASAGITGSFTTILKPDSLFGFVVQRADRIQLLGQFLSDPGFSPQVSRSVDYANAVIQQQAPTSGLFAALPALLTSGGASDLRAFARLTPEAYATATQIGVENALALADVARGPGFAADRSEPGGFTFAQGVGSWYRLSADGDQGTAAARTSGYGFLGGLGYGDRDWSVGAFGGWLNGRQRLAALDAGTEADGFVAGVHGRYEADGFGFGASIIYNGARAVTTRALPGTIEGRGRYDLDSLVADVTVHYAMAVGEDWTLQPRAGVTYLRATRDRAAESGSPFALTVARDRHVAGFLDGGLGFARSDASDAAFRPFVALGVRFQIEGQRTTALGGYAGGPLALEAFGATRSRAVGTAAAGIVQRLSPRLELFSTASAQTGRDDHRESIATGMRLRF